MSSKISGVVPGRGAVELLASKPRPSAGRHRERKCQSLRGVHVKPSFCKSRSARPMVDRETRQSVSPVVVPLGGQSPQASLRLKRRCPARITPGETSRDVSVAQGMFVFMAIAGA
jgi:hypothetical protein